MKRLKCKTALCAALCGVMTATAFGGGGIMPKRANAAPAAAETVQTTIAAPEMYRMKLSDDRSREITYEGTWKDVSSEIAAEGTLKQGSSGAVASFLFTGSEVWLMGSAEGSAGVTLTLDGTQETITVNREQPYAVFSRTGLGTGSHTLTVACADANFCLDGIYTKQASIGNTSETIVCTDSGFTYSGDFAAVGNYRHTEMPGESVRYTFSAVNVVMVEIMAGMGPRSAALDVLLDGTPLAQDVDCKASGDRPNVAVYDVAEANLFPYTPGKPLTLTVRHSGEEGELFKFYGLRITRRQSEKDVDKEDYVLGDISLSENEERVRKGIDEERLVVSEGFEEKSGALVASAAGESIEYRFRGVGFEVRVAKGPDMGKFNVMLENAVVGRKVNAYSMTEVEDEIVFHYKGLEAGSYTVSIVVNGDKSPYSGGTTVAFRGFNVIKIKGDSDEVEEVEQDPDANDVQEIDRTPLSDGQQLIETQWSDPYFSFGMFGPAKQGSVRFSGEVGAEMQLNFKGEGFEIYGEKGRDKGKFRVYIDGVDYGRYNTFAEAQNDYTLIARFTGLENKNHKVRLVVEKKSDKSVANNVVFAMFKLITRIGDKEPLVANANTSPFVSTESWHAVKPGDEGSQEFYEEDIYLTNIWNASMEVLFRGSGIRIFGNGDANSGVFTLELDGKFVADVDCNYEQPQRQIELYALEGLERDANHKLRIWLDPAKNPNGMLYSYISIDYFIIDDYADYVFDKFPAVPEDAPQGSTGTPVVNDYRTGASVDLRPDTYLTPSGEIVTKQPGLSAGALAGISVGAAAVGAGAGAGGILLKRKKKK